MFSVGTAEISSRACEHPRTAVVCAALVMQGNACGLLQSGTIAMSASRCTRRDRRHPSPPPSTPNLRGRHCHALLGADGRHAAVDYRRSCGPRRLSSCVSSRGHKAIEAVGWFGCRTVQCRAALHRVIAMASPVGDEAFFGPGSQELRSQSCGGACSRCSLVPPQCLRCR